MLAGLVASLVIRRRRVFVRVGPGPEPGRTVVSVGGLAKDDDEGMPDEIAAVLTRTRRNAMTDQTLAQLSNLAIYSAMVVLTLAMIADAVYLARLVPAREAAQESARERELVTAGGAAEPRRPTRHPGWTGRTTPTGRDAEPLARAQGRRHRLDPHPARHRARRRRGRAAGARGAPLAAGQHVRVRGLRRDVRAAGLLRLVDEARPALARACSSSPRCCSTSGSRSPSGTPTRPS